jgi:hypothetical protein
VKLLSTRARAELRRLQDAVRSAAKERERVLRVLALSRSALTPAACHDVWLEFSWCDQEYHYAVANLAAFVDRHGKAVDANAVTES